MSWSASGSRSAAATGRPSSRAVSSSASPSRARSSASRASCSPTSRRARSTHARGGPCWRSYERRSTRAGARWSWSPTIRPPPHGRTASCSWRTAGWPANCMGRPPSRLPSGSPDWGPDMLRISLQTLRARRGTLAGAFVAIWLAVTLACATGLLMAGVLGPPGAGRLAAADAVVRADPTVTIGHGEDADSVDVVLAPRLPMGTVEDVAAVPGVARAVGDIAFSAGAWDAHGRHLNAERADRLVGHGWKSAALTPYQLTAGRPPRGPRDVVADVRLGTHRGATLRIITATGAARYRVSGLADARGAGDDSQAAVFFRPAVAAALAGAPGRVNAVGVIATPGTSEAVLRDRLKERLGRGFDVLDRAHAADADAGDPTAADRAGGGGRRGRGCAAPARARPAAAAAGAPGGGARAGLTAFWGARGGPAGGVPFLVGAGPSAPATPRPRREPAVLRALGAPPPQ